MVCKCVNAVGGGGLNARGGQFGKVWGHNVGVINMGEVSWGRGCGWGKRGSGNVMVKVPYISN